ncbi:MAG TPA: metalloregulator ArsR/SmtB family transcription factor [Candidatus Sulfotelmatobacter sp.]|jgi:ArsR family transcriptional regulator|nr:metalloregulator ArsR/SmtB family transcription factor [Candidatus Sulfotelmatobacter sp.]
MEHVLAALRAAAEPTRLRLLSLCAQGELTVSELVGILGQSQPRVSRHLKLMCEGGLLERFREGAWVFYRLSRSGAGGELARRALDLIPDGDPQLARDNARLAAIQLGRAASAAAYFDENAGRWAELRSWHIDEAEVEAALRRAVAGRRIGDLLDIGTGTGRLLEVLGPQAERAEGIDASREMLAVARAKLEAAGLRHCGVRQADMYALPFADGSFDMVVIHQVLHFADTPASAVAEAGRVLRPGGLLALVDFAPHELETLRTEHNHRRLGFADAEVAGWCAGAGLDMADIRRLPGDPLTVTLWLAERRPMKIQKNPEVSP